MRAPNRVNANIGAPVGGAPRGDNRCGVSIDHYENFPVASWLCPPALRPAVQAIYHFARTADDIADEGDAAPAERRAALDAYAQALHRAARGDTGGAWQPVFAPLARAIERHALPLQPLADLLSAFRQDTDNPVYPDRAALLDYCARSADPVGRLLLHLLGVDDTASLAQSDAICTGLQLVNFWQDLSVDLPRGRRYIPQADAQRCGLDLFAIRAGEDSAQTRALVLSLSAWARQTLLGGAPLVHRVPGRMAWELRFVVQGGLAILDAIDASGGSALSLRPTIGRRHAPGLVWRALRMRPTANAQRPARPDGQALR